MTANQQNPTERIIRQVKFIKKGKSKPIVNDEEFTIIWT